MHRRQKGQIEAVFTANAMKYNSLRNKWGTYVSHQIPFACTVAPSSFFGREDIMSEVMVSIMVFVCEHPIQLQHRSEAHHVWEIYCGLRAIQTAVCAVDRERAEHTHTSISLLVSTCHLHTLPRNKHWTVSYCEFESFKDGIKTEMLQIKPSHTHTHTRSLLNGNRGVTSRFNPYLWETTTLSLLWINILW